MDENLTSTTTQGQNGPGSNGNKVLVSHSITEILAFFVI